MAGLTTLSVAFTAAGNLGAAVFATKSFTTAMTGDHVSSVTALVGTSAAPLPVGSVTLGGFVVIKNMHAEAIVYLGASGIAVASPISVGPGDIVAFRSGGAVLYGISNTANTRVLITAVSV